MKKIIIIGNGSRENCIKEKLSNHKIEIMENPTEVKNRKDIDLVIVGSEKYLVYGIVDLYPELKIFGPNKDAARIEGSKIFLIYPISDCRHSCSSSS